MSEPVAKVCQLLSLLASKLGTLFPVRMGHHFQLSWDAIRTKMGHHLPAMQDYDRIDIV